MILNANMQEREKYKSSQIDLKIVRVSWYKLSSIFTSEISETVKYAPSFF
jgi:hypothetical protein